MTRGKSAHGWCPPPKSRTATDQRHALVRLDSEEVPEFSYVKNLEDKEVILLKPSFFGMGIDLKALWSKIRKKNDKNTPNK